MVGTMATICGDEGDGSRIGEEQTRVHLQPFVGVSIRINDRARELSVEYESVLLRNDPDVDAGMFSFDDWSRMTLKDGLKEGQDYVLVSRTVWYPLYPHP